MGWSQYFEAIRAGKYFGLHIECPVCGETPGESDQVMNLKSGNRRWRWLAVHMAEHKVVEK